MLPEPVSIESSLLRRFVALTSPEPVPIEMDSPRTSDTVTAPDPVFTDSSPLAWSPAPRLSQHRMPSSPRVLEVVTGAEATSIVRSPMHVGDRDLAGRQVNRQLSGPRHGRCGGRHGLPGRRRVPAMVTCFPLSPLRSRRRRRRRRRCRRPGPGAGWTTQPTSRRTGSGSPGRRTAVSPCPRARPGTP